MGVTNVSDKIKNVFVLILENRSFDHMLGFSKITGVDAVTGNPTQIEGLTGTEANTYNGKKYIVREGANNKMRFDPGHEFFDVVEQLSGKGAVHRNREDYPPINNSGYVENYATTSKKEGGATDNFEEIMRCYKPEQLPVIVELAKEFAVCDHWFSSIPGPTVPNRLFIMGASSSGLAHSPTPGQLAGWQSVSGFILKNGSLFDLVKKHTNSKSRIYNGDVGHVSGSIPLASCLKGINLITDITPFSSFEKDINESYYPYPLTFIEPNYGDITNESYEGGTSQHPMDDVRNGEGLIKHTYEAIRNSPHWENSLLIITYDEHGGFYDHVTPPKTNTPGDGSVYSDYNKNGFNFEQLGVRVPAIVISPYIPKNTIDHSVYEHSSIPATVENIFNLPALTLRDAKANNLSGLLKLDTPRTDTPNVLPNPFGDMPKTILKKAPLPVKETPIAETGNLPTFLAIAQKIERELLEAEGDGKELLFSEPEIKTNKDAYEYLSRVSNKMSQYKKDNN